MPSGFAFSRWFKYLLIEPTESKSIFPIFYFDKWNCYCSFSKYNLSGIILFNSVEIKFVVKIVKQDMQKFLKVDSTSKLFKWRYFSLSSKLFNWTQFFNSFCLVILQLQELSKSIWKPSLLWQDKHWEEVKTHWKQTYVEIKFGSIKEYWLCSKYQNSSFATSEHLLQSESSLKIVKMHLSKKRLQTWYFLIV